MSQKQAETIQSLVENLLSQLEFENFEITETRDDETTTIQIQASPEDSGMLIGFHGETLAALQLIIGQMAYKQFGEWKKILINVGDYRQKRQAALESIALNAAKRVKLSGQPITLPQLQSNERRIIHMTLSQDPEVETNSEGTGRDRRLIISLVNSQPKEKDPLPDSQQ